MRLQQDQLWKQDKKYFRILRLERLEVEYRMLKNPEDSRGKNHTVTKKEFCRLIKGATLVARED